jgi:sec-independent protein translocase protein TatB
MFNIGGGELIVILLIALIVLGPQRLPDAARQLGKAMSDLRRLSSGFQNEMKQALETADDPKRIAARRNVLGREEVPPAADGDPSDSDDPEPHDPASDEHPEVIVPADAPEPIDPVADSIAAVSSQPSAPPKQTPPASGARAVAKKDMPTDVSEPASPRTNT